MIDLKKGYNLPLFKQLQEIKRLKDFRRINNERDKNNTL